MTMSFRNLGQRGFTLGELLVAVAIVSILSAFAIPAYRHFTKKAKMVEAEMSLRDVERLQAGYYIDAGEYSDQLPSLGFSPMPALQYYTVTVELGGQANTVNVAGQANAAALAAQGNAVGGGAQANNAASFSPCLYRVTATPIADNLLDTWILTKYRDGRTKVRRGAFFSSLADAAECVAGGSGSGGGAGGGPGGPGGGPGGPGQGVGGGAGGPGGGAGGPGQGVGSGGGSGGGKSGGQGGGKGSGIGGGNSGLDGGKGGQGGGSGRLAEVLQGILDWFRGRAGG